MIHTTHAMEYYAAIKKQWGRFLYESMVWSPKYIIKLNVELPYGLAISPLSLYTKDWKQGPEQINVCQCSLQHCSQYPKAETTKVPIISAPFGSIKYITLLCRHHHCPPPELSRHLKLNCFVSKVWILISHPRYPSVMIYVKPLAYNRHSK